jgi:cobyrinic acid a,c-diamide synthase
VVIDSSPESTAGLPRLVIAAPGSGHGKTTVATGLMGALTATGLKVAGFKIGPDYIDPGYHTLATGRLGRNLDPFLCGEEQIAPLLLYGAQTPEPADAAVIEGVMGLFDGQIDGAGFASTAHVASLVRAPVIMVIDISHTSRTAAAIAHGLNTFDPTVRLAGVIINKSGSERHAREVVASIQASGLDVLGVLPRDAGIEIPSRHLGLVPAAERHEAAEAVAQLAQRISDHVSLSSIISVAQSAPPLESEPWSPTDHVEPPSDSRPVVAIAGGRAFTFRYAETDELLRAAGCKPVVFDPIADKQLPAGTAGLYLGGGFPEVHAAELAANHALRTEIRAAIDAGTPTVAECAGLLYLCRSVDGRPMVGAIEADAIMTERLTLRYRTMIADHDQLLALAGVSATGHEFHRTVVEPCRGHAAAWLVNGEPCGFSLDPAETDRRTVHASYLHLHWAGYPGLAQRFANAVHDHARTGALPPCTPAGVDKAFMDVLLSAMAENPEDRLTAAQFRDQLTALNLSTKLAPRPLEVTQEPSTSPPATEAPVARAAWPEPPPKSPGRWERRGLATVAIAALVIAVASVVAVVNLGTRTPAAEPTPAVTTTAPVSPTITQVAVPAGFIDCSEQLGNDTYCASQAECWAEVQGFGDLPWLGNKQDCNKTHIYQTFIAGRMTYELRRQSQLESDAQIRRICTTEIANSMLRSRDRRSDWEIWVLGPQQPDEYYFRCILGRGESTESLNFHAPG